MTSSPTPTRTAPVRPIAPVVVPGPDEAILPRWKQVVEAFPDNPCFASAGTVFSFARVDRLSDVIAATVLDSLDPADERPIGLLIGHDAAAFVVVLALIKTGRLQVVLDGHLPAERLGVYAEMAGIATVLADDRHLDQIPGLGAGIGSVLSIQTLLDDAAASDRVVEAQDLPGTARSGRDAYGIVFTSGSSGKPKGVLQMHKSVVNEALVQATVPKVTANDRVLGVMPLGFVAGVHMGLGVTLNGASIWLFDPRDHGLTELHEWIVDNGLTVLASTPYVTRSLAESLPEGTVLENIRLFATGGEAMSARDVELVRSRLPETAAFSNAIGSSEASTLAIWVLPGGEPVPSGTIPVGKPVPNKRYVLLDSEGAEVPRGETGELAIISEYMSLGYWNDAEKTATAYVTAASGEPMFLQGDLGRIDENGDLVLGGRADSAVKIRGYLVEPGEVEATLYTIDELQDAVVLAVKTGDISHTRLVAYVSAKPGTRAPSAAGIRRILRQTLPEYMVPADIVQLTTMPRTERGKVDRQNLPPVPERVVDVYQMNQRELAMSTIWQQVLELPAVGPDDDFMALGGDSLATEELVQVVRDAFDVTLPANEILAYPTLREFTRRVDAGKSALPSHSDIVTLNATGTETPLFCFTGGGSLALTFMPLSRHFSDTPVYAFQAHGMTTRAIPDWSVEAMATRFIRLLRIVRPHGPYRLAGHSFGGLVAAEVARQLTAAGEEVEALVILDTYLPRNVWSEDETQDRAEILAAPARRTPLSVALGLKKRFVPDGIPRGENIGRQARAYLGGMLQFEGQLQYDSFLDRATLLGRKYVLKPYAGRTVVVMTDDNVNGEGSWDHVLTGEHGYVHMDTEHTQLLREPHVAELAEHVRAAFAAAASSAVPAAAATASS